MPTPLIKSFAKKSGKSKKEVEKLYKKAKKIAAESGHKDDYDYITGILKNMLSLKESVTTSLDRILELSGFTLMERNMQEIKNILPIVDFTEDEIYEVFDALYEIEYKYSMIKKLPFEGLPQRKENMIKLLKEKALELIPSVAETFETVFSNWLRSHALTDPEQWAKARLEDSEGYDPEEMIHSLLGEYARYSEVKEPLITMVTYAMRNLKDYPAFESFLEDDVLENVKEVYYSDIQDNLEDFNESQNKNFETEDEASEYVDSLELSDIDPESYFFVESPEQFASSLKYSGNLEEVIEEFYRELVFPSWYDFWGPQGIDETRDNVEEIYQKIVDIENNPLEDQLMILNLAKNAAHQNGDMMDYYEQKYQISKSQLDALSNSNAEEWNKELKEIGVQI